MPRVDIWIRKEDVAKWDELGKDKPHFITLALNSFKVERHGENAVVLIHRQTGRPIHKDDPTIPVAIDKRGQATTNLCEHFQPKGQCMVKGCKFGKGK